ncbi:hypothetical protein RI030_10375 [Aphanizomenon flos-aquae NRERC-008]|uniref:Uncharacterized protein n=1 Tax=Aphanizomenon flos-aquae FACHB-1249 TaxID=2692889 RepID=A0ABR8IW94_APHFL|nr:MULTISPECIES: hypothetical protein [Aphanizomenon]MBD2633362.1 hypothetical protein [Aphanizomenon sp. FACHB-1399]MBD2644332.1 hypothetical protein [Aphanizomenon sp. FACHB-1401]MBD2687157.1 hypothetical protein [Aphanizomenon flos-aquae FACHB-1249]MDS9397992.1 hypothetical protein [Aphanizomenon flos-aquae NRERC-008]
MNKYYATIDGNEAVARIAYKLNEVIAIYPEMLNVVTKLYIFKYTSIIKGKNVNIS